MNKSVAGATLVLLVALAAACGSSTKSSGSTSTTTSTTSGSIAVSNPWAYSTADVATKGVVYLELRNQGTTDDALVAASVPAAVAKSVELHETVATPGSTMSGSMGMTATTAMMPSGGTGTTTPEQSDLETMNQVDKIPMPAGKMTMLEPGGYHIMLMDLVKPLTSGETVPVTLTFAHAPKVTVNAVVRDTAPQ